MAIEVTVRFAGTLLEVVVVGPGRSFRLGTAPGVDIAVTGLISFPLVDSTGLIRIPAGLTARRQDGVGLADIAPLALTGTTRIRLAIGAIEIDLAVAAPVAPLARLPIDRRPLPYLALALVAHLAVWTAAMSRVEAPPTPRLVHARLAKRPPPPLPPRPTAGAPMIQEGRMGAKDGGRAAGQYVMRGGGPDGPRGTRQAFEISGAELRALIGTVDLGKALAETDGPIVREEDGNARGFGGSARFDPSRRPGFESVKTGRYATVSRGRGAGDDYHLSGETQIAVELCATAACVASGAIDRASVHSWIAPHAEDFRACYDGTPHVVVDFTIADGVVHGAHGRGATGTCAAAIVSGIAFPHTGGTTRVRYEVSYRSS